jgi:hypothetical protein
MDNIEYQKTLAWDRARDYRNLRERYSKGDFGGSIENNDLGSIAQGHFQKAYPDIPIPKSMQHEAKSLFEELTDLVFPGGVHMSSLIDMIIEDKKEDLEYKNKSDEEIEKEATSEFFNPKKEEFINLFERCEAFQIKLYEILDAFLQVVSEN